MIATMPININKVQKSRIDNVDFENLQFGKIFADHMFSIDFEQQTWQNPRIEPYDKIQFEPSLLAIHYGQAIFEGMKAYRTPQNEIVTFRPLENLKRLNRSAERMCMPALSEDLFMEALQQLISLDKDWVPSKNGSTLYIRPFMFATDELVGMNISETYRFMIITSPVGAYYAAPVKVKIETEYLRAAKEGGVGYAKTAGNYAASMYPMKLARQQGYDQVIWTDSRENKYLEEFGTMNIFLKINGKLLTPETGDSVLSGITRDSLIQLAKHMGVEVEERKISIEEVIKAIKDNTLEEVFGAGTAAVITPIALIGYQNTQYTLKPLDTNSLAFKLKKALTDIQTGKAEDIFQWMHKLA
ncbi:MAG: branched-chain amino acid aminotransferase [Cytophagales bacterium]|nr:MAG: branched-chain amino acid aminotransferase [Cytophagales bacterium]